MEKLAYLLWNDDPNLSADGFRDCLIEELPGPLAEAQAIHDDVVCAEDGLVVPMPRPE